MCEGLAFQGFTMEDRAGVVALDMSKSRVRKVYKLASMGSLLGLGFYASNPAWNPRAGRRG